MAIEFNCRGCNSLTISDNPKVVTYFLHGIDFKGYLCSKCAAKLSPPPAADPLERIDIPISDYNDLKKYRKNPICRLLIKVFA